MTTQEEESFLATLPSCYDHPIVVADMGSYVVVEERNGRSTCICTDGAVYDEAHAGRRWLWVCTDDQ